MQFAQFAAQVSSLYEALGRRPLTRTKMRQVLRELSELTRDDGSRLILTVADLTTGAIARWEALYGPRRSPAGLDDLLAWIRAIASWAILDAFPSHRPK